LAPICHLKFGKLGLQNCLTNAHWKVFRCKSTEQNLIHLQRIKDFSFVFALKYWLLGLMALAGQ